MGLGAENNTVKKTVTKKRIWQGWSHAYHFKSRNVEDWDDVTFYAKIKRVPDQSWMLIPYMIIIHINLACIYYKDGFFLLEKNRLGLGPLTVLWEIWNSVPKYKEKFKSVVFSTSSILIGDDFIPNGAKISS